MGEVAPYCNVEHHPHKNTPGIATHIHKKQLGDAKTLISDLEAENRALKAQLGEQAWRRDTPEGDLLIGLAEAFDIAHTFANASPAAGQTDIEGGRTKPSSREPRGGSRNARNALRDLIRSCESALQSFHNRRIHHDFRRPNIRDVLVECEHCGSSFAAMTARARFCSDACRSAAWRTENERNGEKVSGMKETA